MFTWLLVMFDAFGLGGRVGISVLWLYVFYLVSCLLEVSVGRCGFNSVVMHGSLCLCACWCC